MAGQREWDASNELWTLSSKCKACFSLLEEDTLPEYVSQGLSGRALRRLPVLAHARAISRGTRFSSRPAQGSPARSQQHTNGINGTNLGAALTNGVLPGKKAAALTVEQWIKHMDAVVQESRQQLDLLV